MRGLCTLALALTLAGSLASVARSGEPIISKQVRAAGGEDRSAGGRSPTLLRTLHVPDDEAIYGRFRDWGYWAGTTYRQFTDLPPGYWVYLAPNWYVWDAPRAERAPGRNWGPEQATGEPDTGAAGDLPTAWASKTPDGQPEWLDLRYAQPVSATAVLVHATYNPGALVRVSAFTEDGREVTVWTGKDPAEPGTGRALSVISFRTEFPTRRVRIYLDSPAVAGWNEIDAVGLVDDMGRTQWASDAEASSTYASSAAADPAPLGSPPGATPPR